jgi:hypothetical protein
VLAKPLIIGAYAARRFVLRTPDPTPHRPRGLPKHVRNRCATPRQVSPSGSPRASRATATRVAYSARWPGRAVMSGGRATAHNPVAGTAPCTGCFEAVSEADLRPEVIVEPGVRSGGVGLEGVDLAVLVCRVVPERVAARVAVRAVGHDEAVARIPVGDVLDKRPAGRVVEEAEACRSVRPVGVSPSPYGRLGDRRSAVHGKNLRTGGRTGASLSSTHSPPGGS